MQKKRKWLWILFGMLILMLALPVSAEAATTKTKYTLSGVKTPTTIKKGGYFSLKGTIKCNKTIKEVRVTVYDLAGKKCYQRYVGKPKSKTFNLAVADPHIQFNKLSVGSYYLKVRCEVSSGKTIVVNKKFTVTGTGKIKVVNPKPAGNVTINKGAGYSIGGTVQSTYKLSKVTASIINSSSKTVYTKSVKPNKTSYNVANSALDSAMLFNKLAAGTYKYKLTAVDNQGTSATLIYRTVTVKAANTNTNTNTNTGTIKVTNPVPAANITLTQGKSYAIGGRITSTYKLTSVTAAIINSSNKIVYTQTVIPNTTSYNVANSKLDDAMLFNKLAAGTYRYKLTATDAKGKSATLIYRTITVKSATNTTPGSTGGNGNTNTNTGDYLNTTGAVTIPANYTPRTGRPAANNKYYYNATYNIYYKYNSLAPTGKPYYGKTYVLGNCTWYACGRAMEIVAKAGGNIAKVQAIFGLDPVGIYNQNVAKGVFEYGTTPKIGALAIFNYGSTGDAHIAVVENIINGVPYVSESGYTESTTMPNTAKSNVVFKYQSIYNWAGGRSLRGYIYLV